jgi:hypothetical protein
MQNTHEIFYKELIRTFCKKIYKNDKLKKIFLNACIERSEFGSDYGTYLYDNLIINFNKKIIVSVDAHNNKEKWSIQMFNYDEDMEDMTNESVRKYVKCLYNITDEEINNEMIQEFINLLSQFYKHFCEKCEDIDFKGYY